MRYGRRIEDLLGFGECNKRLKRLLEVVVISRTLRSANGNRATILQLSSRNETISWVRVLWGRSTSVAIQSFLTPYLFQ